MTKEKAGVLAAITYGLLNGLPMDDNYNLLKNGVIRNNNVWDNIQLTKSERKGKTTEEIQALRKAKYLSNKEEEND